MGATRRLAEGYVAWAEGHKCQEDAAGWGITRPGGGIRVLGSGAEAEGTRPGGGVRGPGRGTGPRAEGYLGLADAQVGRGAVEPLLLLDALLNGCRHRGAGSVGWGGGPAPAKMATTAATPTFQLGAHLVRRLLDVGRQVFQLLLRLCRAAVRAGPAPPPQAPPLARPTQGRQGVWRDGRGRGRRAGDSPASPGAAWRECGSRPRPCPRGAPSPPPARPPRPHTHSRRGWGQPGWRCAASSPAPRPPTASRCSRGSPPPAGHALALGPSPRAPRIPCSHSCHPKDAGARAGLTCSKNSSMKWSRSTCTTSSSSSLSLACGGGAR